MKNIRRKKELQKTIAKIENLYPEDNLILSYSDFLKERDYLAYYQFNPILFENLLVLTNNLWKSSERINRLSLLQKTKRYISLTQEVVKGDYYYKINKADFQLSLKTRKLLFELFRKSFEESQYIRKKQLDEVRRICNGFLINIELTQAEEEWFCANINTSEMILNRVLRYPAKSETISRWASGNFNNNTFRNRRAELLSWILDREPNFEIDQQTIIDDFEYSVYVDKKAIQDYDDEMTAIEVLERELSDYLPKKRYYENFLDYREEPYKFQRPELNLTRRYFDCPADMSRNYPVFIPNFKELEKEFYKNLKTLQQTTMIWGVAYSRLDPKQKMNLFKKYYTSETYYSIYKICKRTKNAELLKWLLEQQ